MNINDYLSSHTIESLSKIFTQHNIAYFICITCALIFFLQPLKIILREKRIKKCTETTTATVGVIKKVTFRVRMRIIINNRQLPLLRVCSFSYEVNGKKVNVWSLVQDSIYSRYNEDDKVKIKYNPNRITDCYGINEAETRKKMPNIIEFVRNYIMGFMWLGYIYVLNYITEPASIWICIVPWIIITIQHLIGVFLARYY